MQRKEFINYARSGSQGNSSLKNSVRRLSSKKRLKEIDKNDIQLNRFLVTNEPTDRSSANGSRLTKNTSSNR